MLRLIQRVTPAVSAAANAALPAARTSVLPVIARRAACSPAACFAAQQPRAQQHLRHFSVRRSAVRLAATPTPTAPSASPASAASGAAADPAPKTTADEQTDAEAGLNRTVQKQQQQQAPPAAQPASATSSGGDGGRTGGEDADGDKSKGGPLGPASWSSVVFLIFVGGAAVLYYRYQQDKQQNTIRVETIGTPLLGGPFSLIDDNGKRVTSDSLKGRYVLLYFGFTYCPDICPTELRKMETALQQYASMQPQHPITPVFISIDPARDTPKRLKEYKKGYSPAMLWLTGTDAEVSAVAKAYRVYYSAPEVEPGSDDDYLVDHSIFFYLLDREGQFLEFFGKSKSAEEVSQRMAQLVAADNK